MRGTMEEVNSIGISKRRHKRTLKSRIAGQKPFDWNLFSKRLHSLRLANGYTQTDVETCIGMNRVYYRNWEVGAKTPGAVEYFYYICNLLQTDPRYLLGMTDEPAMSSVIYTTSRTAEASTIAEIMECLPQLNRHRLVSAAQIEKSLISKLGKNFESVLGKDAMRSLIDEDDRDQLKERAERRNWRAEFNWDKFAARLRSRREALGYTQADMKTLMGMHRSYYANWEIGGKKPNVLVWLRNLSMLFQTEPRYLLGMIDVSSTNAPIHRIWQHRETTKIIAIIDNLPLRNRQSMAEYAKMEEEAAVAQSIDLMKINARIINYLNERVHQSLLDKPSGDGNEEMDVNHLQLVT